MVKSVETLEDLQRLLSRGSWFCFWLFPILFLVGVPFAIVPDLANLKGSVSTSVVLQSYIVVYGLVLTLTATTATLNANHAREIVRDLREMQPVDQGGAQDLAEAINLAEGLRKDVFISEVFVYGCIPRRHC